MRFKVESLNSTAGIYSREIDVQHSCLTGLFQNAYVYCNSRQHLICKFRTPFPDEFCQCIGIGNDHYGLVNLDSGWGDILYIYRLFDLQVNQFEGFNAGIGDY
jgi:hypothetical protein